MRRDDGTVDSNRNRLSGQYCHLIFLGLWCDRYFEVDVVELLEEETWQHVWHDGNLFEEGEESFDRLKS